MGTNRSFLLIVACALGVGITACGSSGTSASSPSASLPVTTSSPATSSAPASSPATSGMAAEEKAIATNWVAFFNAKTPTAKRVTLVQDGQLLAPVLKAQAGSGLASSASAKVTSVTVSSPTQATVVYTILVSGVPALKNQKGIAVKQGGTWKVGLASFCGLLFLENSGKKSGLPSVCKSAG